MKRKLQLVITASAASVLGFSALAQDTSIPKMEPAPYTREHMPDARAPGRLNDAAKASDLIGMTVKNYQGEKLGKVEELAMDVESGRVVQVIISSGGFAGIGDTLTAVPPGALHHDVAQKVLHLDADKAKLKSAPKFETVNWAECCDSNHLSGVYGHYGQEPAFTFINSGDVNLDGQSNQENASQSGTVGTPHRTWPQDRGLSQRQDMIPATRLGQVQRASKLIGTPVKNLQDEKLGKVENILVDLPAGRIVAVIISSGGFLGLGDELSAVPPSALRFASARDTLQLDASKETLASRPHFKANQWADLGEPSYTEGVYRAYGIQPYFITHAERYANTSTPQTADETEVYASDLKSRMLTRLNRGKGQTAADRAPGIEPYSTLNVDEAPDNTRRFVRERIDRAQSYNQTETARTSTGDSYSNTNATDAPDNTARNVRDRNAETLTPLDQSNSQADVDTTAQIRKEIIAGKDMSMNAKNIKIITSKGQVTLRGPVDTAEEKQRIGEIANRIAHSEHVDNQLEVKGATTTTTSAD